MRRFWGWTIENLSGCLPSNAFAVKKGEEFDPECWARWDYHGHRKAFASYLRTYHPEFRRKILDASVHVDHLEPKFRFTNGERYFVRLHLVERKINLTYGAGIERNFFFAERTKPLTGASHMSWLAFCKAIGTLPPGKNAGTRAWREWARNRARDFADASGESAADAYAGLLGVLQLGYTGYYSGKAEPFDFDLVRQSYQQR